jgi:hypothetical protein
MEKKLSPNITGENLRVVWAELSTVMWHFHRRADSKYLSLVQSMVI